MEKIMKNTHLFISLLLMPAYNTCMESKQEQCDITLPTHMYRDIFIEKLIIEYIKEYDQSTDADRLKLFFAQTNKLCLNNKELLKIIRRYIPAVKNTEDKLLLITPLLIAALKNNWTKLAELILQNTSTDQETLNIALIFASETHNEELYYQLIQSGAQEQVVENALLSIQGNIDKLSNFGISFSANTSAYHLYVASQMGYYSIAKYLLFAGQSPNFIMFNQTPLQRAISLRHTDIIKLLCSWPTTDINFQDRHGNTALIKAIVHADADTVKILLNNPKIDVNLTERKNDFNALIYAILNDRKDIAELLLAHPKININNCCKKAFDLAVKHSTEIAELLMQNIDKLTK